MPTSASEANQKVDDLLQAGKKDEAVALAREYRREWPQDRTLMSVDKIVGYRSLGVLAKARELAREMMEGIRMNAGSMPPNGSAVSGGGQGEGAIMAGMISLPGGSSARALNVADTRAAVSAMSMRDFQKLDEKMSSLLSRNPKDFRAYRGRAYARLKLGRGEEAVADARRAVALEPHDLMSRSTLVDALVDMRRGQEALAEANRGFEARRGLPAEKAEANLYHARSLALSQLGQKEKAKEDLWSAAKIDPEVHGRFVQEKSEESSETPMVAEYHLPEDPLAQAAIGAAGAAALLFPAYFALGWWRRRNGEAEA